MPGDRRRISAGNRLGELAVARAGLLLRADDIPVELELIRNHPDEAGLAGCSPSVAGLDAEGYDAILAVDVGGSNIGAGIVELNISKSADLSKARVVHFELRRHSEEEVKRDHAVERLAEMLKGLLDWAKRNKLSLAPVIGVGCPGVIHEDGSIARGAQNLPGNWESSRFNLPASIAEQCPASAIMRRWWSCTTMRSCRD